MSLSWSSSLGSLSGLILVLLGGGLSSLWLWGGLLSLEFLERQTDDGLLDLGRSSSSLTGVSLSLALLVHLSPSLSPVELNRLDSLSEQRSNLMVDEKVDLSILGDETLASAWVHAVLSELASLGLDNHGISILRKR